MSKIAAILFCLTCIISASGAEFNPYVQKGELIRRVSTEEFGKSYDDEYKNAEYTFIDLGKDRVTVIKDLKGKEPIRHFYIKTSNTGKVIALKREGVSRYTDTIFLNVDKMEFRHLEAAYALDEDFDSCIGYGTLIKE